MTTFTTFCDHVQQHAPTVALVLGSGLGEVPHAYAERAAVAFDAVPGLVAPSVHGHSGRLSLGICTGKPLLVFRGRLHYYEGHPWARVATPIQLAHQLGIRTLLLTNAAGGIHDQLNPGDLMLLRDHLFWQRPNAWQQPAAPSPYSPRLLDLVEQAERTHGRTIRRGVYLAVTGPCYETPAEIRAFRAVGADAVGMSTAYEALTAHALGMECLALSSITNKAAGLAPGILDHHEVLANAQLPAQRLSTIVADLLRAL
jgi:purine-nucleoside phosphorylase